MVEMRSGNREWRWGVETGGGAGGRDEEWKQGVEMGSGDRWWRWGVETGGGDGWWRWGVETGGGWGVEVVEMAVKRDQ